MERGGTERHRALKGVLVDRIAANLNEVEEIIKVRFERALPAVEEGARAIGI
jgi:hypothetical protein